MNKLNKNTSKTNPSVEHSEKYFYLKHFNFPSGEKVSDRKKRTGVGNDFLEGLKKELEKNKK